MRELILTTAVLLMLAASAHATSWDIPDGQGGWKDNPECTGGCADLRDQGRNQKPDRPNGDKPGRIEGEKPQKEGRAAENPRDQKPVIRKGYWCRNPRGLIVPVGSVDTEKPQAARKCGPLVHIKGGVVGQW